MKRLLWLGLGWAGATLAMGAEDSFSKTVRAVDYSSAGLAKLTPAELARLDELVRDYKSGALELAQRQAAAAEAAKANAEAAKTAAEKAKAVAEAKAVKVEADMARDKKTEPGLLAKAKVMLTPGTQVEYTTVESRIAGDFTGWEGRSVLTLENGQRWQIANGGLYSTPPVPSPKVKIVPAALGGFWMTIEGVSSRVRVVPLTAK
jgi:hypothetical protein